LTYARELVLDGEFGVRGLIAAVVQLLLLQ